MRLLPALLILVAAPAAARWDAAPGHPWTYSVTGAESANALALDWAGRLWVAGNTWHAATGRDVMLISYSITQTAIAWSGTTTALPLSSTEYDRAGLDEGAPGLAVWAYADSPPPLPTEAFLVFTSSAAGSTSALTLWRVRPVTPVTTSPFHESLGGHDAAGVGVARMGTGTPFACGFLTAGGVDHLFALRWIPTNGLNWASGNAWTRAAATDWTGSLTLSLTGRAVVADPDGAAWFVAQSGGDVVMTRYTPGYIEDSGVNEYALVRAAGYPKRWTTSAWDEPWGAVRDVTGDIWIAGSSGGQAAIWRCTASGDPAPGFPVLLGSGVLSGLAVDGARRCFATGRSGTRLLVAGVDVNGIPVPGLPMTAGGIDAVEGRGLALTGDGSLWVAATRSAAPATWGGSVVELWRFGYTADPLPVAPGELKIRGPGGEILNLHRGEILTIEALPLEPGDLTIEILTLRGEAIRRIILPSSGHRVITDRWDGRNDAGHAVASGTYAVRVSGGGYRTIKRLVVIRRP